MTRKLDSVLVNRDGQDVPATMTSMNVSMPPYVVAEQTVAVTTLQGRMNAAVSDLTTQTIILVSKVTCVFSDLGNG